MAFAESLSITYGDRGLRVSCLCPQGVNTNMLRQETLPAWVLPAMLCAAGLVLEPEDVALFVSDAIEAERFLILPHPQVAEFEQRKATDRDRWLTGMRKLQARVFGNS